MAAKARILVAVALCLTAERAAADQPAGRLGDTPTERSRALSLVYDAPVSCPSREELLAAVDVRRPARASRAPDGRTFVVRLRASSRGGFDARLDVAREGEAPTTRQVHAATCFAAMTSMAVFITLALAPMDELTSTEATAPSDGGPAGEPPPALPPEPAPAPLLPSPFVTTPRLGSPSTPPASFVWTAGASFVVAGLGVEALGARVAGELARLPAATARPGMALRLSWGWADFSLSPPRAGEAQFRLRSTRAEPCLVMPWHRLSISACGAAEFGALSATAGGLPVNRRATMDWMAVGASGRVRVQIAYGLSLQAGIAALAPLVRRTFALAEPVRPIFRPDALLVEGSLGAEMSATF